MIWKSTLASVNITKTLIDHFLVKGKKTSLNINGKFKYLLKKILVKIAIVMVKKNPITKVLLKDMH